MADANLSLDRPAAKDVGRPESSAAGGTRPGVNGRRRRRLRSIAFPLLAILVGLALAGAMAELVVVVFVGEQVKFPRRVVGAPWGLRYNEPNSRYRHRSADGTWFFRINGQGMRADRDYPYAKPPGVKRIVSLGDSFTIGYEVDGDRTFSAVLEDRLRRAGIQAEVLNAGVSGFSNAEECLYLERELRRYEPDLVLVSFYGNDLVDNIRSGLFRLEEGRLVEAKSRYVPAGGLGDYLNTSWVFNLLSERSNAFALVKERLTMLAKREMVERNEQNLARAERESREASPQDDYESRLAAAIFDRMYRELRAEGIPLVIQSIPSHTRYPEEGLVEMFPTKDFSTDRPGLSFFPARRVLEAYVGTRQLYWYRSHHHWTPFSHRVAGEALTELILEKGLLTSGTKTEPE